MFEAIDLGAMFAIEVGKPGLKLRDLRVENDLSDLALSIAFDKSRGEPIAFGKGRIRGGGRLVAFVSNRYEPSFAKMNFVGEGEEFGVTFLAFKVEIRKRRRGDPLGRRQFRLKSFHPILHDRYPFSSERFSAEILFPFDATSRGGFVGFENRRCLTR
ncbi:MAG: hypothetical protein NVSMB14_05860 [Isosphaeraceae bacterium]